MRAAKVERNTKETRITAEVALDGSGESAVATGIGSGGNFALAAARALIAIDGLAAEEIAQRAMAIAADLCIHTNRNITIETL